MNLIKKTSTFAKKHKKWLIVAALVIVVGGYFFISNATKSVEPIPTFKVERRDVELTLTLSGEIKSDSTATLGFLTAGKLTYVGAKTGDSVKKGQLLAALDKRELKKNLEKDLNLFMKSRWDYDQQKDDYKDKAITDAMKRILDKAQFDLNNAVVDVELQNLAFEFSNLISPIDGVVTVSDFTVAGANVGVTHKITIVSPESLVFEATADQSEVIQLENGKTGNITLDSFTETTFPASISSISFVPKPNESGTVYGIEMTFTSSSTSSVLRVGMTGDISFPLKDKKNVIAVPISAVEEENGSPFVTIVKNDGRKTEKRTVSTGLEGDEYIEITSGLLENEIIRN